MIERDVGAVYYNALKKREGDFSCEISPSLFRLSETRFGFQITTLATPELRGTHERQPVLLPHSSHDRTHCKSFPSTVRFQLPGSSLVADSRRPLLVRPLLWKISLPLKPIVLSTNANASACSNFLLWKWRKKSGNSAHNYSMLCVTYNPYFASASRFSFAQALSRGTAFSGGPP
jgi:hypothetical protein